MDAAEARRVLGVGPGAGAREVRSAFRRGVRAAHPDVGGPRAAAGAAIDRLVTALATLQLPAAGVVPPSPAPTEAAADGEELFVAAPPDEAFDLLLGAADALGEVTHAEPENGLLEVVLTEPGTAPSSVLVTLQGRAMGTEAFCTLEPLVPGLPVPALADVVAGLAHAVAQPAP